MATTNSVFSDIDPNMGKQNDGDMKRMIDEDAVRNSLNNIVSTIQGNRRMLPEFASDIHKLLFEPIDESTARQIADQVVGAIELWDDRVEIIDFIIQPLPDVGQYKCSMEFQIRGTVRTETIDFVLK